MKSEAVKLAEIDARNKLIAEVMAVLKNPIVIALGVFIAVEYLQKKEMMGENVGTLLEGAVVASPVLQALATSGALSEMVKAPIEMVKSITALAPLALAK